MVMPATLRAMLNAPTRGHDFGPDDSTILSSLYHPVTAGRKLADFLQSNIETAAGLNSGYDNPNPLLGPSDESRVNAALTLAGLMQTGSMPFGPVSKGGTLGSIPVWHGSPHKFDEFSLEHIGKGEGAQAYGHGLYFAENPAVAQSYKENLTSSSKSAYRINDNDVYDGIGTLIGDYKKKFKQEAKINKWIESPENALSYIKEKISPIYESTQKTGVNADFWKNVKQYVDSLSVDDIKNIKEIDPSFLYKVSLEWPDAAREAADPLGPQHFLDWDKTLNHQSDDIAKTIKMIIGKTHTENIFDLFGDNIYDLVDSNGNSIFTKNIDFGLNDLTGEEILSILRKKNILFPSANRTPEEVLHGNNIPGLRYLDGGSRGSGNGTYNYVVFDDKIPKIVERNGVSLRDLLGKK